MIRINGLFHLLMNGVYWGYNPLTNLFTNFLGYPSGRLLDGMYFDFKGGMA